MTTLVDNVLGYQRLDAGPEELTKTKVLLDAVVAAGVDGRGRADRARPGAVRRARPADRGRGRRGTARDRARASRRRRGRRRLDGQHAGPGAAATSTRRSWWPPRSAEMSYGSRCAGRSPGVTRCTSRSCAGSCARTAECCRRTRCPGWAAARTSSKCPSGAGPGRFRPGGQGGDAGVDSGPGPGGAPNGAPALGAGSGEAGSALALPEQASPQGGGRRRARRASVDAFLESEVGPPTETAVPTGRRRRAGGDGEQRRFRLRSPP